MMFSVRPLVWCIHALFQLYLQAKLELVTGAPWPTQDIEVYTNDDKLICRLDNNDALIGSYPIDDNMRLHVSDTCLTAKHTVVVVLELLCCLCQLASHWQFEYWLCFMQVIDRSNQTGNFDDVSHVKKYEMSDDDYSKRTGQLHLTTAIFLLKLWLNMHHHCMLQLSAFTAVVMNVLNKIVFSFSTAVLNASWI